MVYKRASGEAGAIGSKLNLRNLSLCSKSRPRPARSRYQLAIEGMPPPPIGESLIIAWPQAVALIASTIVLFVAGYIVQHG
jgi:hypothetical protein